MVPTASKLRAFPADYRKGRVAVYRNLHNGLFSVRALDGAYKGKVVAHLSAVFLFHVKFRVSDAGRAAVLRTGRKNVHAWAEGWIQSRSFLPTGRDSMNSVTVSYNPRVAARFFLCDCTGRPLGTPPQVAIVGANAADLRLSYNGKPQIEAALVTGDREPMPLV
jgi:hypothetical protein